MIQSFFLAAALLPSALAFAQEDVQLPGPSTSTVEREADKSAPQLVLLDQTLTRTQKDKEEGRIDENRYREFLTKFRADLEAAITRVKSTPPNAALHARILSRLGDPDQALAALSPAIGRDPDNAALRVGLGHIHYDKKDYPAALAEAHAVLKRDPANKDALALKYISEGRITPGGATPSSAAQGIAAGMSDGAVAVTEQLRAPRAQDSPKVQALVPKILDARGSGDMRVAMNLTQELMRTEPASEYTQEIYRIVAKDYATWQEVESIKEATGHILSAKAALKAGRGEEALAWAAKAVQANPDPVALEFEKKVREIVGDSGAGEKKPEPKDGGVPVGPIFPAFGLGAAAYAVAKSRKTVESEDGFNENDRPQPGELQRFVAGVILSGAAGAGLYLGGAYAVGAGSPLVSRFMAGPGQYAVRLAQSEAGAINPNTARVGPNVAKAGIWSPGKYGDPTKNALEHWNNHKLEFPELQNSKEYVEAAWRLVQNPPAGTLIKDRLATGERVFYHPSSNTFVVRTANGVPKTMFKPSLGQHPYPTNLDYFNAQ